MLLLSSFRRAPQTNNILSDIKIGPIIGPLKYTSKQDDTQ